MTVAFLRGEGNLVGGKDNCDIVVLHQWDLEYKGLLSYFGDKEWGIFFVFVNV